MKRWPDQKTQWATLGLLFTLTVGATVGVTMFASGNPFASKEDSSSAGLVEAAERYRQSLVAGDLDDNSVLLTLEASQIGLSAEAALSFESECLDWSETEVVEVHESVTPFNVQVTFANGFGEVTRWFSYEHHPGSDIAKNRWLVTLDGATC